VGVVFARSERATEHGGHPWWLAVLGAVLVAAALALIWSAVAGLLDRSDRPVTTAVAETAAPYLLEPAVQVEQAEAPLEAQPPRRAAAAGRPARLLVPGLDVNAPVVPIGAPGRVLTPPSDPQTLGWWQDGAVPGAAQGGALITGHTVHTGGGALDDLEKLRQGDRVIVRTAEGTIRYAVTGTTIYRKATLARDAERVFRQSGPGRLVLITCEDWTGSTYLSNVVVFADPI
jgi:LPXTG-site transpeptidase (sortase) family protein